MSPPDARCGPGDLRVYYVDDHFVPYTGAKPSAKVEQQARPREKAARTRTSPRMTAAVATSGDPSGCPSRCPRRCRAEESRRPGAKIMLGFDRGGAYPRVTHCREQTALVTYRRAPLRSRDSPSSPPSPSAAHPTIAWPRRRCSSRTTAKPGSSPCRARQGRAADPDLRLRCLPCRHPGLLKSRWRELPQVRQRELRHKQDLRLRRQHRDEHQDDDNPARKKRTPPSATRRRTCTQPSAPCRAAHRPGTTPAAKNKQSPPHRAISAAKKNLQDLTAARKDIPAKLPATRSTPRPHRRLRAGAAPAILRRSPTTPSTARQLPQRLPRDDDEYRATTRETIIRGLRTITFTPATITVTLEPPGQPRVNRPSPCFSTRSTTPRPSSPATTGRSPTESHPNPAFNPSRSSTSEICPIHQPKSMKVLKKARESPTCSCR